MPSTPFWDSLVKLVCEGHVSTLVGKDTTLVGTFFTLTIIGLSLLYALAISHITAFDRVVDTEPRRICRAFQRDLSRGSLVFALAYTCMLISSLNWSLQPLTQFLLNVAFVLHLYATLHVMFAFSAFNRRIAPQLRL